MAFKIDIHNHILPERWPDLKEVSANFAADFKDVLKYFLRNVVSAWTKQIKGTLNIERFKYKIPVL